ncbi:MAG: hypothetical protein ACK5QX_00035 [bacterium]|jgi:hypothetical protein
MSIKKIAIIIFAFCFMLFKSNNSAAQRSIRTHAIHWEIESAKDLTSNKNFVFECSFETSSTQVKWNQKKSNQLFVYNISESIGEWSDVEERGSFILIVSDEYGLTELLFKRNLLGVSIELSTIDAGIKTPKYLFTVSKVE